MTSSSSGRFMCPVGHYIAPEVLAGRSKSVESDAYSFGRIGQKIINLRRWIKLSSGNSDSETSTVPTVMKAILDQCVADDKTGRPKMPGVIGQLEDLEKSIEKKEAKWSPWVVDEKEYLADKPQIVSAGDLSRADAELASLLNALN